LKDEAKGDITFNVSTEEAAAGGGEEGEEEAAAEEGGEEGEEGEEGAKKEIKAALPLKQPDEVNQLLDAVRFPYLSHDNLGKASINPVLHEAGAQHIIVKAFSSRLNAYEPGGDKLQSTGSPRGKTMPAGVPPPRPSTMANAMGRRRGPGGRGGPGGAANNRQKLSALRDSKRKVK
jgi:hypothetical protein